MFKMVIKEYFIIQLESMEKKTSYLRLLKNVMIMNQMKERCFG